MAEVVIGVRGGPTAKSRCGEAVGGDGWAALVEAMLSDMMEALARTPAVSGVHVVTPTRAVADLAATAGANVILEDTPQGLNAAFERARSHIAETRPAATVALLPGDLPLLDPRELEQVLRAHDDESVVLVPAIADGGTGAVILRADLALPLAFGHGSFRRHIAAVQGLGLLPRIVEPVSLGFDLDRPSDIAVVLTQTRGNRTAECLRRLLGSDVAA